MTRRRALVTGGAGFIGSHLCLELLSRGYEVICLDDFSTGRMANIAGLLGHPRFEVFRHDVTQPFVLEVQQIYNLACPGAPAHYQLDPMRTVRTSVMGAFNVLDLAERTGARVLQASTSEIYGDPEVHPQPESYQGRVNCTGPRACYDEGKRLAETLFFDYYREHHVDVRVARVFNTYGPRMATDDGRVISTFVVQALRGEPLTIHGDGRQTRSFCYVGDVVRALVGFMESDVTIGPVNIGNPRELSIRKVAQIIVELTGSKSPLVRVPGDPDDAQRKRPDIRLARELLGFKPTVEIEDGLEATIRYFRGAMRTSRTASTFDPRLARLGS